MRSKETFYPESRFGGFTDIDGTIAFYNRVNALLQPSFTVLDLGCGRGEYSQDPVDLRRNLRILRGKAARVIGIDVDPEAGENPYLDQFHLIQGGEWPLEADSIDLIVCDNVLEHIADPAGFFGEITRVLRGGGLLCIRTPNRWSYVAIAARLIPNRFHSRVAAFAQENRQEEDVFPTIYACNTRRKLQRFLGANGFVGVVYGYEAEPGYLDFSRVAYLFGVLHQRISPSFLKPALFAFARLSKKGS